MKTLIILGPTAVGKTAFAVKKAEELNGEILSADSMQVYRGMNIGTAKPTKEEMRGIPHHLIDIRDPDENWTVSDFIQETTRLVKDLQARKNTPIIVGGTGLYLWSLLEGFSFPIVEADPLLREKLKAEPLSALYSRLLALDPEAAKKIHPNDQKRIIRALEVIELTGEPISKLQENRKQKVENGKSDYELIGLDLPREELYRRIEERVDKMIEKGLIEEVKGLLNKGYSKDLPSMQALGYKEVIGYLEGNWTEEKMVEELKKRTRNFAKRQMTWFKRFENVNWLAA